MSIWASIKGENPPVYDGGYAQDIIEQAWFDVATGWGNIRILIRDEEGSARIGLDLEGARELRRRLNEAITFLTPASDFPKRER